MSMKYFQVPFEQFEALDCRIVAEVTKLRWFASYLKTHWIVPVLSSSRMMCGYG